MDMKARADAIADEMVRLRRDIHAHPELGFEETRTAQLVADTLRELGIEVKEGVGRTGVTAEIGTGDGPTIAIRADMDALPILSKTGTEYESTVEGVMHACGHDAHTAMLLGVAHLLKQSYVEENEKWHGNVRFLFQPSEEKFGEDGISGATAMLADNAMDGVDQVIATHVYSQAPTGIIGMHDGLTMAAVDSWEATITGDGGHGAYPHQGVDPIHILSQVLSAVYAIPSRLIDPMESVVISIGQVQSDGIHNVIPKDVRLKGTIRSQSPETRKKLWEELETAFKIAELMGGTSELKIIKGYPVVQNDAGVNAQISAVTKDLIGEHMIAERHFGMGAEDFAYMTEKAPGAMFMLGAMIMDGVDRPHHTDLFDIDEDAMPIGAAILAETARRFVTKGE